TTRRARALALVQALVLRHRIVLHDLALEDPDLDPAGTHRRVGGGHAVINIRTQRVQRNATFTIPLHARDLGAAETAGAVDADSLGTETHRRLDGALHGAAERNAALQLLGDRLGHELRIDLGLAHLDDVNVHLGIGHRADLLPKLVDIGALLADDD